MIVLNDLHLGAIRSAGTTPLSALCLREWMQDKMLSILDGIHEDLAILGDLFDTYSVPYVDLLKTYNMLSDWLKNNPDCTLYLVEGNHDISTDSSKMSSFQFLGELLEGPRMTYIAGKGQMISDNVYVLPHLPNQDIFDLELSRVPECRYLLVHANYDNNFAKESDHSLNMSKQQAQDCKAETIFFAHEHDHRLMLGGKVYIAGNQFPASISDCLAGQNKCYHRLHRDGIERIESWNKTDYAEVHWRDTLEVEPNFIRIIGKAKPEEAAEVADRIAKLRKVSNAFVIGNAVKMGADEELAKMEVQSLEDARSFKVMDALKAYLSPEQFTIVESLK